MSTEITLIQKDTFEVIKEAVNEMVDMIRPTYGPASNKVIIDTPMHFSPLSVDDGVQIARDYKSPDFKKNSVAKIIKEVAIKTNDRVGDGTTGALIMLQAIINEVGRRSHFDGRKIELELKKGLEDVKKQLLKSKREIKSKEDLKKVALVAFDHPEIAELLADTYYKLGKEATITVDKSSTMETTIEMTQGPKINSGYISPYMVTNPSRMETVIENPYILLTDYRLTETNDLFPIIDKMFKDGKHKLVIIAENVEQHALATILANLSHVMNPQTRQVGAGQIVAIAVPSSSSKQVFLEDLGILTGAKVFSSSKGDKVDLAEIKDLGRCERFICKREESIIIGPKGKKGDIGMAVTSLRKAAEGEKNESHKKDILKRLGLFTNRIAVIKVGASTEKEQTTLKYKVDDAVHAVKAAFKGGVVSGSGLALGNLKTSSPILNEALKYPHRQLCENMGLDNDFFGLDEGHAMNVVSGKVGPFMGVGVMDPVDVLLAGVESAVSIASILVTTKGIQIERQKDDK